MKRKIFQFKNVFNFLFFVIGIITLTSFEPKKNESEKINFDPIPKDSINPTDTFPTPSGNKKMMFFVQRTHNINTIVYELNYNADSTINTEKPIHPYWLRYADKGEVKELSYLQNNYAYGINSLLIDKEKQTFKLNFVSYKKRDMYLMKSKYDQKFHAYITIDGKLCSLERVFVKIEGGTFWVPHITYVLVVGRDNNNKKITEKIIP